MVRRIFWVLKSAADAYGIWQLLGVFGLTAVITTTALAFIQGLRENLTLFGQIVFGVGVFLLLLVVIRLMVPPLLERLGISFEKRAIPSIGPIVEASLTGNAHEALPAQRRDVRLSIHGNQFSVIDHKGRRLWDKYSADPHDLSHFPRGRLQTLVSVSIAIYPQLLVQNLQLQIDKYPPINAEDFLAESMETEYVRDYWFTVPPDVTPGEHDIAIIATVDGTPERSSSRKVRIPKRPALGD